jgi:dTDP-4-amino-4,6-dideoxygalactose transaminase
MKPIRSAADLAINGAPPSFSEPVHVGRPHVGSRETFLDLVGAMLDRRWFTNDGPLVQALERRIADYLGVRHCVATSSGTTALEIAARALGLAGEVIVPSYTFVATAHALAWQGITPVFADIDPATHNLDPAAVRAAITPRTTGIVGVHLWGRPAPVDDLQAIADAHGLQLLFDAAHAFGCSHRGRMIGGFGRAEVLSFHATKFFHTFEGGAVVTDDDALADALRLARNFGFAGYDSVVALGINGKMAEACAAMGLANLDAIDAVIAANRRCHADYCAALGGMPGVTVLRYDAGERSNWQYVVLELGDESRLERDAVVAALHAENVLARQYFWPGCHRMEPYRTQLAGSPPALPNTDRVASRVIVLPTGPTLPAGAIEVVAAVLRVLALRSG